MKKIILIILLLSSNIVFAGISASDSLLTNLKLSTYFESYYTYDFSDESSEKLRGIVNHHKNNEIAINLALLRANYANNKYRANLGVMIGTYADKNYSGTDAAYKYIYESNVGIRLSKKQNVWFDIGIMPSHIGIESAVGIDNWTLTRSLQAEASPYYEAGARIAYTSKNGKLYASILALNGWQVIAKQSNYPLSIGTQIQYKPSSKILLNSSSYLGNNNSYSNTYVRPRYFHNFFTQIKWNEKFSTIIGIDVGAEEIWNRANYFNIWYSPIFMAKYSANNKHSFAFRAEYLDDRMKNIFPINNVNGFWGSGFSVNYDLSLSEYAMFRIEAKLFSNKDAIFADNNNFSKTNKTITSAFIFHLND